MTLDREQELLAKIDRLQEQISKSVQQMDAEQLDRNQALEEFGRRCIYTIRSGIIAASNVEALTQTATELGVFVGKP